MQYKSQTIASVSLIFLTLTLSFKPIQAEEETNTPSQDSNKSLITFQEPDYSGEAPDGKRRGFASRTCEKIYININPLIPANNKGLTIQSSPEIWFNLSYDSPITSKNAQQIVADFSLEDIKSNKKVVKNIPINLPLTTGNFSLKIPYALEQDKWYRWYLVLPLDVFNCSDQGSNDTTNISVQGLIQRVNNLSNNISTSSQNYQEMTKFYAEQGIWYDALDQAAQLKCQTPPLVDAWNNLLKQAEFDPKQLTKIIQSSRCYSLQ